MSEGNNGKFYSYSVKESVLFRAGHFRPVLLRSCSCDFDPPLLYFGVNARKSFALPAQSVFQNFEFLDFQNGGANATSYDG